MYYIYICIYVGTVTGKREIIVDGEMVLKKGWMFSLVGSENFKIGGKKAAISITSQGWNFEYTLQIEGKNLKRFLQGQLKTTRTWFPVIQGKEHRIVLETCKMDVWVDGKLTQTIVSASRNILNHVQCNLLNILPNNRPNCLVCHNFLARIHQYGESIQVFYQPPSLPCFFATYINTFSTC